VLASPEAFDAAKRTGKAIVGTIDGEAMLVQSELRKARSGRDAVRAGCLDALLTQLHVASRAARDRIDAMGDGAGTERDALVRELARLRSLEERSQSLGLQAKKCAGADKVVTQTRTVTHVPDLPDPPLPSPQKVPR